MDSLVRNRALGQAALVCAGMITAWGLTYLAGGSRTAAPHAFYVPVVLAALWFRPAVAAAWAIVVGVAAGPFIPVEVATGAPQSMLNWMGRLAAFVAVALLVSMIEQRRSRLAARDLAVAQRERDLEVQRGAILQIIAHEIRTPVTVLKGSLDLIGSGRSLHHEGRLLEATHRSLERLEDLTTLVTAATGQPPTNRPDAELSVVEFLDPVLEGLSGEYDRSRVKVQATNDRCLMPAPEHLRLALRLLLENALRFSDEPVDVRARLHGPRIVIRIADRGPGMPEAMRGVVQPFVQGDPSTVRTRGGVGLGLYTASRLLEHLGGRLQLRPREPNGTQVLISLPVERVVEIAEEVTARRPQHQQPPSTHAAGSRSAAAHGA